MNCLDGASEALQKDNWDSLDWLLGFIAFSNIQRYDISA